MKKSIVSMILLITFFFTMSIEHPLIARAADTVSLYTTLPDAVQSTCYSLTVNGQSVFVEKYKDISYARFSFSGTANITVTASENISSNNISPHSYNIAPTVNGSTLSFSITQSRKLIVNVNSLEKLFIFADPIETGKPSLSDPNVVNIMSYTGIDNTGNTVNTAQIQQAINDVAARANGGILYFPDGKYKTGTLHIKSKVTVYLEDGALIKGSTSASDYPYPLPFVDGSTANVSALICFDQAYNAKLTGRGAIDGDGKTLRATKDVFLIETYQSNNIIVEDVILRDPSSFNSHITYSDNVTYQRTKLINDVTNPNTDGIDPDCSRHVVIDDVFSYCSDDSVSVKGGIYTSLTRDSYDITVKNNVFWTKKSCLKVGSETFMQNIYDVLYTNNDIIHADRAIVCYVYDGANVANVRWVNNRAEVIGGDSIQRLIDFTIIPYASTNNTLGTINNVCIKDFYAESFSPNNSVINGYDAAHKVTNLTIDNMVVAGVKKTNTTDAHITKNAYCDPILFGTAPASYPTSIPAPFIPGAFAETNGQVVFEAEHYSSKVSKSSHDWTLDSTMAGTMGTGTMVSGPDNGTAITSNVSATSPQMDYKVNFNTPGTYYVWARSYSKDTNSDTFHMGIDGSITTATTLMCPYGSFKYWNWNNKNKANGFATINVPTAGLHTINVWMGEDGICLDKFLLMQATDGNSLPKYVQTGHKGMGPVESVTNGRTEAENITLTGYSQEANTYASNGNCVTTSTIGTAKFNHYGTSGTYSIIVKYFDENDGNAVYNLYVNGTIVDSWTANQNLGSASADASTLTGRTINGIPIKNGDEVKLEGIANGGEGARMDYIGTSFTSPLTFKTEAENMTLSGYSTEANAYASNGNVIKTASTGTAKFTYSGTTTGYSLKVAYFDENDGNASYKVYVNGLLKDRWTSDKDLGSASPVAAALTNRQIYGVTINPGDEVSIEGTLNLGESARVDYIEVSSL